MTDILPTDLGFPFHIFGADIPEDTDVSFAYHALFIDKEDKTAIYATCNDIPCDLCKFQEACESGKNKTKVLSEYASVMFPEMKI